MKNFSRYIYLLMIVEQPSLFVTLETMSKECASFEYHQTVAFVASGKFFYQQVFLGEISACSSQDFNIERHLKKRLNLFKLLWRSPFSNTLFSKVNFGLFFFLSCRPIKTSSRRNNLREYISEVIIRG